MTLKRIKPVLVVILVLAMILSCGCQKEDVSDDTAQTTTTATEATTEEIMKKTELQVGYSRQNITPTVFPIPFASTDAVAVVSELYATVIAVSDGTTKALLITLDLQTSDDPLLTSTLNIAAKLGVPKSNVMVCTTHNHSAPSYTKTTNANVQKWHTEYNAKIEVAIKEALEDMSVCQAKIGTTTTENYAFVRRYIMQDGSFGGIHVDNPCKVYKDYETKIDDTMQVIRFSREGKKDVLMVNWQAHPSAARSTDSIRISADYIDQFREKAEEMYDVHFAFYQGAAGNIAITSKIGKDQQFVNYIKLGKGLADRLGDALENMKDVSLGEIKVGNKKAAMEVNHTTDHLLDKAKEVKNTTDATKQNTLCRLYGFQSKYEASAIINRAKYDQNETMSFTAITIGDLAFVSAPFEMFDTTGMYIKENSPYEMTFIMSCTNGSFGYVPSENAFANGGYEVYTSRFVKGTAEKAADILLELIEK